MTKIQCSQAAETSVMGTTYRFTADKKGRFVADVYDERHVHIFLAVEAHYKLVDEDEPAAAPRPVPVATPAPDVVLEQLRAEFKGAVPPKFLERAGENGPVLYAADPWPALVPVTDDNLNVWLEEKPAHLVVNGDSSITITAANGVATYTLKGSVPGLGHVFALADGSSFQGVPAEAPAAGTGQQGTFASPDTGSQNAAPAATGADGGAGAAEPAAASAAPVATPPASSAPATKGTSKPQLDHDGNGRAGGSKRRTAKPRSAPAAAK